MTFGATDMPLKAEDLEKDGLVQFPTVMGGVVAVVNLDGITPGELGARRPDPVQDLSRAKSTSWDDAAIKKLNPSAKLPPSAIVVVHRSDGSGTTFVFTDYLSKVSADWKSKVGANYRRRMAGRPRRQGQRRRRQQRCADQGLDRLRRIRLCQAEQADVLQADQPGRQDCCSDVRSVHRFAANADWARHARASA